MRPSGNMTSVAVICPVSSFGRPLIQVDNNVRNGASSGCSAARRWRSAARSASVGETTDRSRSPSRARTLSRTSMSINASCRRRFGSAMPSALRRPATVWTCLWNNPMSAYAPARASLPQASMRRNTWACSARSGAGDVASAASSAWKTSNVWSTAGGGATGMPQVMRSNG